MARKKRFLFAIALLALCAGHAGAVPGLLLHLQADGNAGDASGNGHNGTLVNGAGFAPGRIGQAFNLDGVDDYVHVPHAPGLNPSGSFTLAAWIKPTSYGNLAEIIGKWGDTGPWANQRAYGMNLNADGGISFPISTDATQLNGAVHNGCTTGAGVATLNAWNHVALVYDGSSTRRIFVNGVLTSTRIDAGLGPVTSSIADLTIGVNLYGPASIRVPFKGLVDDIRLYDRALADCGIAELAGTGSCNQPPVANAGLDQNVEATHPTNTTVTLNGTGSSDPDNDPLNYIWSENNASIATGAAPYVGLGLGAHLLTLTVNDGKGGTASDQVEVRVVDTTAPVVSAPPDTTVEATGLETVVEIGTATVTDAVGPVALSNNAPAAFPVGITQVIWTATDAAGNVGNATQTVTVTSTNRSPVANNDEATTDEDHPVQLGVTANDTDPDNDALTVVEVTQGASGMVVLNQDGTLTYTPNRDFYGQDTFTYTLSDGKGNTAIGTVTVNVVSVNDPATMAAIPDPAPIPEDSGNQTILLTGIGPGAGEPDMLDVRLLDNSNPGLFSGMSLLYRYPYDTGSLSYMLSPNAYGTAVITLAVLENNSIGIQRTFRVVVTPVNDPPTLAPIADPPPIRQGAGRQTVALAGISAGPAETQSIAVSARSSNPALIPDPVVSYTSPGATGSLSYTPVADASGTATITVTVSDGEAQVQRTFNVVVNPLPTLAGIADPAPIPEDSGTQTLPLSGITASVPNSARTLTVSAASSNPALIPDPVVSYTSPGTTGLLSYTPAPNASGTATITVTVSDGEAQVQRTFRVVVTPVNDPPALAPIADPPPIRQGAGRQTVALAGISAGPAETQSIAVSARSSNPALIPDPVVSYTSPGATGSLSYTPVADATGTATITVTVSDGEAQIQRAFNVKTTPKLPLLSVPPELTVKEGMSLGFIIKAQDPNYSPPLALGTLADPRTLPAGATFRADTLTWYPLFNQAGKYKLVFGAQSSTSPRMTTTKAVEVTVKDNRYPNLVVGGTPLTQKVPVYTYVVQKDTVSDEWFRLYGRTVEGFTGKYFLGDVLIGSIYYWRVIMDVRRKVQTGYATKVAAGEKTGFEIRKKNPVTTSTTFQSFTNGLLQRWDLPASPYGSYAETSGLTRPAVGNVDGAQLSEIVVGAGPGSGGLLTVYSPTGKWAKSFTVNWSAYNKANGETWPAVGDLNRDGKAEIVTGFGRGGQGRLYVYSWDNGQIVFKGSLKIPDEDNYHAIKGTTRPAIGDLTGDGKADIAVGVEGYGENKPTRVYILVSPGSTAPPLKLEMPAAAGLDDARYNCETWPAIGDLDGDGRNELVINVTKVVNEVRQPVGFGVWTTAVANGKLSLKLRAFMKGSAIGPPALGDVLTPDGKAEIVLCDAVNKKTLSSFSVKVDNNGKWTITRSSSISTGQSNPYPAIGIAAP